MPQSLRFGSKNNFCKLSKKTTRSLQCNIKNVRIDKNGAEIILRPPYICIESSCFDELANKSTLLADKSMFLKDWIESSDSDMIKTTLLLIPEGHGKTTILVR